MKGLLKENEKLEECLININRLFSHSIDSSIDSIIQNLPHLVEKLQDDSISLA